ncbi:MAG: DUF3073 domain-containing protein [Brachybacterium sp.]|nr:DUF3073 domain-containing protein [Brachybacterium sp.]
MGRGRQKAKHTKVARDLKYYSPPTDLSALQRELQSHSSADVEHDDADDERRADRDSQAGARRR